MSAAPPSGNTAIEVVLFDWAGTITVPMSDMLQLAVDHLGFSDAQVGEAFGALATYFSDDDSIVHQAERGQISDRELIDWLELQAPGASGLFDPHAPSFLNAPDRPEMIDLLWWLQDVDVMVMLATNNFASAQEPLASRYLDSGLVHAIVNSALVGARKPEPEYWDLVLEATDAEPERIVLLDDNKRNLDSAADRGMHTIEVGDDPMPAIAALKGLLGS